MAGKAYLGAGGEGWIRTSVRLRGQIYSLLPLTTRPPLQAGQARHMATRFDAVNLGEGAGRHLLRFARSNLSPAPGSSQIGAGEGNRTLVVSLEGFCSTIELHPLAQAEFANATAACAPSTPPRRSAHRKLVHPTAVRYGEVIASTGAEKRGSSSTYAR
jgi:hypothetical protein